MEFSANDIAGLVGGIVEGNPDIKVNRLAKIEEGEPQALSFLANPKYHQYIYTTQSSVVMVHSTFEVEKPVSCTLIRVDDPYSAFASLLDIYDKMRKAKSGISPRAAISQSAKLGSNVYIGDFVVIGDNVVLGDNVHIYPNSFVGDNCKIGNGTILNPNVVLYYDTIIGAECTLHAGVVIGADGFGFAPQDDNNYKKVAQIGNVIIEDNVEIGANTTIDRATLGSTIIHRGVKLDNLIQVGHNVEIGANTVIAAQTGIAGSTKLGNNCMIGGQVGFAGHIVIADDVKIGAQAGLAGSVDQKGVTLLGAPAIDISRFRRIIAIFNNLDKLYHRLGDVEKSVKNLENQNK